MSNEPLIDGKKGRKVQSSFLIMNVDTSLNPLISLKDSTGPWSDLVATAYHELYAALQAASLPLVLTLNGVQQRKFDRFHSVERINHLIKIEDGEATEETIDRDSQQAAVEVMEEFSSSEVGPKTFAGEAVKLLYHSLSERHIAAAAEQLLRQTTIAIWASFENFARSLIVSWINAHPRGPIPLPYVKERAI